MRITLKEIAKRARVSVTTASLILNGKEERFKPATVERVKLAAEDMQYSPNKIATALITRKSRSLGLILPDIRNPFFAALAHGIGTRADELGYSLMQSNSSDSHEKDLDLIQSFQAHLVDGLLFCMAGNTTVQNFGETLRALRETRLPFVFVDRYYPDFGALRHVGIDHFYGGQVATNHLLDLGHRQIVCISGPLNLSDAASRASGYTQAMSEAHLPSLILEGNYHSDSGYRHCLELFRAKERSKPRPTAVFACNDLMAMGVLQALSELGLSVPEDVSVVGYDDIFMADLPQVKLTTIRQPIDSLGRLAVDILLHQEDEVLASDALRPRLMQRRTTAAPI